MFNMIYIAFGDSITYGENASSVAKAYPALIVSKARASSRPMEGYVLARPGWDSNELLDAIAWKGDPLLQAAAVVSVWIGGVDLLERALPALLGQSGLRAYPSSTASLPASFMKEHERVMRNMIALLKQKSMARIVLCTQYNPFPASPLAVRSIAALNRATVAAARKSGVAVAPAHEWFEGRQPSLIDGYRSGRIEDALSGKLPIHPNNRGHRVIAQGLSPNIIGA